MAQTESKINSGNRFSTVLVIWSVGRSLMVSWLWLGLFALVEPCVNINVLLSFMFSLYLFSLSLIVSWVHTTLADWPRKRDRMCVCVCVFEGERKSKWPQMHIYKFISCFRWNLNMLISAKYILGQSTFKRWQLKKF